MSSPPDATSPPAGAPPAAAPPPTVKRNKSRAWAFALVAVVIIVVAGLAVGYEQGWFNSPATKAASCGTGTTLQGNGAQIVLPLMDQWETAYSASTGNQINYPAAGSGTGITDFSAHPPLIDFAVTDDPLTASEAAALPGTALTLPITAGALAIVYNLPGVTGHLNLTGALVADIYLGKITKWNNASILADQTSAQQAQLNALTSETIITVHRSDAAGTTFVLTNFLSEDSPAWNISGGGPGEGISISWPAAPTQEAEKGNSAVLSYVEGNAETIGYSDLTDVLTATSPPAYAAIQNPKGTFVVPTIASAASAVDDKVASMTFPSSASSWYNVSLVNAQGTTDYPMATFIYLFVYQAAAQGYQPTVNKTQVLIQFINWALTTGQTYSDTSGLYYVALPAAIVSLDQAGLQTMTFNGAAIPSCT
jgi:phosphate transport system substrate-binding protein